jgi:cell division septal protein FtsQ
MRNPNKRRHGFFILLLLLGITGIGFIGTDGFQIKEVTIVGNAKIAKEDIIKRAGIPDNCQLYHRNIREI